MSNVIVSVRKARKRRKALRKKVCITVGLSVIFVTIVIFYFYF